MSDPIDYSRLDPYFHDLYRSFFAGDHVSVRLAVLFLSEFRAKNAYAIEMLMRHKPTIVRTLGYLSMSCAGGYAMPVWQHICNEIKEHKTDASYRHMASLVARLSAAKDRATLLFQFGFRGDWLDLVREALALGVSPSFLEPQNYDLFSPAVIKILEEHVAEKATEKRREAERVALEAVEEKLCAVCMDAEAVSQLVCGHVCMCKTCGRDARIKECPICRTPYQ